MIEALCVKDCYDSDAGIAYYKGATYTIDEQRFAIPPKGLTVEERSEAKRKGQMIPNGLIKHFKTVKELPPELAARVEESAHEPAKAPEAPRPLKGSR